MSSAKIKQLFIFNPLFIYPFIGLIVFAPCLLGGKAFFDGDLFAQFIPMRIYLKSAIAQGHFPLWNPFLLGGQPFFADPNAMAAYPFTYLTLPLPVPYGFGLFYFFHFLIAAWGMHFWLKTLELPKDSRFLGGFLFALSGFFSWEIIHPSLLAAFAWIPWWGAFLEKVSQKLDKIWAFAAGLAFAFLFMAGSFQVTLGAIYGGALYLSFRLLTIKGWSREGQKDKRFVTSPLFFLWGAFPLLIFWIPAKEFLELSERLHSSLNYESFQADLSLDPNSLLKFIFPMRPFESLSGQSLTVTDSLANAGYLGPWSFFLFVLALGRRKPIVLFFTAAGFLSVLTAFGKYFPLHYLLCLSAPGFGLMRAPFRYLFLFVTSGSLLAAFGFEFLCNEREKKKIKNIKNKIWMGALFYSALMLVLAFETGLNVILQLPALLAGTLGLYFWLLVKEKMEIGKLIFLLSLLFSLVITAWFCGSSRWGSASNFDYVSNSDVLSRLAQKTDPGRVLLGDSIPFPAETGGQKIKLELPPDSACVARIRDSLGYSPLVLDKTSDLYTLPPQTFARLMSMKVFVTGDARWRIPGFATENRGGVIWGQNQNPVSFVYAPEMVESVLGDQQRLALMRKAGFNPYKTTYLSEPLPGSMSGKGQSGILQFDLQRDDPDEQVFKITKEYPGWVVFSEILYPGWKAWIDGKTQALLTANHVFRSLWMEQGSHEVTFRYEPDWFMPLLWGGGIWILSVFVLVLGPWKKSFWRTIADR